MSAIVEQVGGEFGATVRYLLHDNRCSVEFFAAEITGRGGDDGTKALYWRRGATSSEDNTSSFDDAERYVEGSIKWDGCSHVSFGDDTGYIHICGRSKIDKMTLVLETIYERCGQLMRSAGTELLDGEFTETANAQPTASVSAHQHKPLNTRS